MRALAATILLAAVAAGCGIKDCKDNTLLLQLTFDGASAQADHLSVQVTTPGGPTQTGSSTRGPMGASGTLEIDFGSGYPAGKGVTITVTALQAGAIVGMGSASATLSAKCARVPLAVTAVGGTGNDMATGDDLSTAAPDLASLPDMASCVPSSASVTQWVDPALGADDAMHGALPGACAFKTITYALAHATGRINLANVTYSTGEQFPLVLNGTQILDCDPNGTGTKAKLMGTGDFTSVAGTVVIRGTANQLLKCELTSPAGTSTNSIACVQVLTSGAHIIDSCLMHNCATSSTVGISGFVSSGNSGGVTLTSTSFTGGILNCLNQIGPNWTVKNMTCMCGNDGINSCGAGLTGCGNTITGGSGICNGCSCPANFMTACS